MRTRRLWPLAMLFLGLTACPDGADTPQTAAHPNCPRIIGENHLAVTDAAPGALPMMLHIVERKCPVVGTNSFRLFVHDMGGDTLDDAAAALTDATPTIHAASLTHSTNPQAAGTVELAEAGAIEAALPAPGTWALELHFSFPDTVTDYQAVFALDVAALP